MRQIRLLFLLAVGIATLASAGWAQQAPAEGPYKVLKTAKVGGDGGFDYVYADADGRRLYIPRSGSVSRITIFDLDTLEPAGEIPSPSAHGVAVDPKTNHGFATSKPLTMFDTKTISAIRQVYVQGGPDGILFDPSTERIFDFSHNPPEATAIDAKDGSLVGTIDLGGAPEQAVADGNGHLYVDLEDKGSIAVVDTQTLMVTAHYDLAGKGGACSGLAMDVKNQILFAVCRNPQTMVILSATDGAIITTLPIGSGVDGAVFNPNTMEAFSSQGDGTLTVVKENSPKDFMVEQTVQTMQGARTLTLDSKTNHILLVSAAFAPSAAAPAAAPPTSAPGSPSGAPPAGGGRPVRGQMVPDSFSILVVGK
jgi:DNA-binding beta-propeller fold protein YncE